MKKIILFTYFFPPANFVGGDRIAAWAKYLHKFGYYPTIITRNWNNGQKELTDKIKDNSLKHEFFETHEVYRLPYKRTFRDRLNDYPNSHILRVLRKALSLFELIANNFFLRSIPYCNFYDFTVDLINKNPEKYSCLIASGRPFQLFFLADTVHKKTNIRWFADYRDEWNTFQNTSSKSFITKLVGKLESKSEIRWTRSCESFITVSEYWQKSIASFINKPGFVVMNGFEPDFGAKISNYKKQTDKLIVSYIGTLYPMQKIEVFFEAAINFIHLYNNQVDVEINFIGIEVVPGQRERVQQLAGYYLNNKIFVYERMDKARLVEYYQKSDFLLATGFDGIKGWYPVKIFEYGVSGTSILLCPGDKDVMDDFVRKSNCGKIAYNSGQCLDVLIEIAEQKKLGKNICAEIDMDVMKYFSRENQTSLLAEELNSHIK